MNKFLKHAFIFIAGFLIINLAYFLLIYYSDWNFRKRHESLRFKNPNFDVLVLGNSLAFDGFDTEYLTKNGVSSYNLALLGSSMKTNYIQLDEYLKNYKTSPKVVIIGNGSFLGSNVDNDVIHPIVEITMNGYFYSYKDIPLLKFPWLGIDALKKVVSKTHREAVLINGQLKFKKNIKDNSKLQKNKNYDIAIYQKSIWLSRIVKLCYENQIQVIIVEMPGFKKTRNESSIGPSYLVFNQYQIPVYNFNGVNYCKIFDDEKDWIGNNHLNENGAQKFTGSVLPIINQLIGTQSIQKINGLNKD